MNEDLKKLIEGLFKEGKSVKEVSAEVVSHKSAIALDQEELANSIYSIQKSIDFKKLMEAKEKAVEVKASEKAAAKQLDEKVGSLVSEKLKSINIDPSGSFSAPKITSRFDYKSGCMVEETRDLLDAEKKMNEMLVAKFSGDSARARAISREIDQHNSINDTKATIRSDSDSVGGYSVPTEVEAKIMQLTYEQSRMLPKVNRASIIVEDKIYPTIGAVTVDYIANQDTAATESNPTFSNPTIDMERVGAYTDISNTIIRQKGANLTDAFKVAYASANARFIDTQLCIGNITGNGDLIDGLVWQGSVTGNTAKALNTLALSDLTNMVTQMDYQFNPDTTVWIGNTQVMNELGVLENTGGNYVFPQYISGGAMKPLGYEFLHNPLITNVLDVGGDDSTGGTDTVLMLADLSKFVVGIDGAIKIDTSEHVNFTKDVTTMRGLQRIGFKLLFQDLVQVQELTGA